MKQNLNNFNIHSVDPKKQTFFFLKSILLLFLVLPFLVEGQKSCYLKVSDQYTKEAIPLNDVQIQGFPSSIDSSGRYIILEKSKAKELKITAKNYKPFTKEFRIRKHFGDTIHFSLSPTDSLTKARLEVLLDTNNFTQDTLHFVNSEEFQKYIFEYLSPFAAFAETCEEGICSGANSYKMYFFFQFQDSFHRLELVHFSEQNECIDLKNSIKRLVYQFPLVHIEDLSSNFSIPIKIFR